MMQGDEKAKRAEKTRGHLPLDVLEQARRLLVGLGDLLDEKSHVALTVPVCNTQNVKSEV